MFQTLRNAWKIEDLRKKLLFTLLILVIVRLGCAIPVPFLDPSRLQEMLDSTQGNLLGYLNLLTGGAFAEATLFALGVSPYITASIVIQLLTVAIPSLERMAKDGTEGQKKIKKITRYSTIGLAILQAYAYYTLLRSSQFTAVKYTSGAAGWISAIAIVMAFSAGAMLVMWLGERIDDKGIGNGISLILFAGIVARIPTLITRLYTYLKLGEFFPKYYVLVPIVVLLFIAMIAFIVLFATGCHTEYETITTQPINSVLESTKNSAIHVTDGIGASTRRIGAIQYRAFRERPAGMPVSNPISIPQK